jgi:hypothetical protein
VIGGGFGVQGALTGIAIAGLLNALTTRSEILTIVHVELVAGEFFALYGGAEPHALRISLSPAFVACSKSIPDRRRE